MKGRKSDSHAMTRRDSGFSLTELVVALAVGAHLASLEEALRKAELAEVETRTRAEEAQRTAAAEAGAVEARRTAAAGS